MVVNQNPKYFKKLAKVMQKTDARTVSNYLMWRAAASSMSYLNNEAREIREPIQQNFLLPICRLWRMARLGKFKGTAFYIP